jgi:hypothetical protein
MQLLYELLTARVILPGCDGQAGYIQIGFKCAFPFHREYINRMIATQTFPRNADKIALQTAEGKIIE